MCAFLRFCFGLSFGVLAPCLAHGQPAEPPKIVRLAHEGQRVAVAFSPDGKTLATGGVDNHIRLWDVATAKPRRAILAHAAPAGVSRLAFLPDGKTLASASWAGDGTVKLWDFAADKLIRVLGKDEGGITFLAVSPNGQLLAWGNGGKINLHNLAAKRQSRELRMRAAVDSAAFSPDNTLLATASGDGAVRLWEIATRSIRRDLSARQTSATGSQAVAFSRDGKTLATASAEVRLWDVATGAVLAKLGPSAEHPFCVAISPDGRFLAGGGAKLRLWDLSTRKQVHVWDEPVGALAFSSDGRWLALGSRTGGAALVDLGPAVE